jgi:dolichol-phosphate mannosyltransferase
LVIKIGFVISSLAILFAILNLYLYFSGVINVTGYASLIISIWFFSGLIIFILGIVGLYIGKIFDGIKNRPLYLVDKKIN